GVVGKIQVSRTVYSGLRDERRGDAFSEPWREQKGPPLHLPSSPSAGGPCEGERAGEKVRFLIFDGLSRCAPTILDAKAALASARPLLDLTRQRRQTHQLISPGQASPRAPPWDTTKIP